MEAVDNGNMRARIPWNAGRIIGPKPPLKQKHIWAIRAHLQLEM